MSLERFAKHPRDLRNNNEVLNLVRPDLVEAHIKAKQPARAEAAPA